jgi:hypothetical protein
MSDAASELPASELHTYMLQRHTMRLDWPLRFSDGERVVAVVDSLPVPLSPLEYVVTVLVEMPAGYDPQLARTARREP